MMMTVMVSSCAEPTLGPTSHLLVAWLLTRAVGTTGVVRKEPLRVHAALQKTHAALQRRTARAL
eukprot:6182198-Pleurochrysis_carterae.AAC.2